MQVWQRLLIFALIPVISLADVSQKWPKYWPTQNWISKESEFQKSRGPAFAELDQFLFNPELNSKLGPHTDAALVIYRGYIVYERYQAPYNQNTRHAAWSMAKSFLNTLTGIGVKKRKLALSDSICKYLKEIPEKSDYCRIKVSNLLTWTSGIWWKEHYENDESPSSSSVIQALYGDGHLDMAKFVISHPLEAEPDSFWRYSTGDSLLLSALLKNVFPEKQSLWTLIFNVIGMKDVVAETDASGTFVGSSYLYAPPREFAKWAYLYLKNGEWAVHQLLSKNWISQSTLVSPVYKKKAIKSDPLDVGGASFWLNKAVPEQNTPQPWPDAPDDTYAAEGHWGQSIFIIPSLDAIVLRFGNDRQTPMNKNELLKRLRKFLK